MPLLFAYRRPFCHLAWENARMGGGVDRICAGRQGWPMQVTIDLPDQVARRLEGQKKQLTLWARAFSGCRLQVVPPLDQTGRRTTYDWASPDRLKPGQRTQRENRW